MTATIRPRTEAGLDPVVRSFNRITRRPLLRDKIPLVVAHYTGVNRRYKGTDTATVIRSINRWKPNEYNYVIDQGGGIWEFSGQYQAAHAKGFNDRSYGVLFLNGVGEPATPEQVEAFRFLMGCLLWTNRIEHGAWVVGHRELVATACPGEVWAVMPVLKGSTRA